MTLEKSNLSWLRGQVKQRGARSLSEVLDQIIVASRTSQSGAPPSIRSVVGTVQIDEADPDLALATKELQSELERSLSRPVRERKKRAPRG